MDTFITTFSAANWQWLFVATCFVLAFLLVYITQSDGSRRFRMPGVHDLHPVTISARSGDIRQYLYTVVYYLHHKGMLQAPEVLFNEDATVKLTEGNGQEVPALNHEALSVVLEWLHENPRLNDLLQGKGLKALKKYYKDDRRKLQDLHLLRSPALVVKNKMLFWLFAAILLGFGGYIAILMIASEQDYSSQILLMGVAALFFAFYRRPFDRNSRLGKKYHAALGKAYKKNEFDPAWQETWHLAIFGYNNVQFKGSPAHQALTNPPKEQVAPPRKRRTRWGDSEGPAEGPDFGGGDDGD